MIELAAGGASDVGRIRSVNQDSWLVADLFWAVADGMGGHQGGEVASQVTIDVLGEEMDEATASALTAAAKQANRAVHHKASENPDLRGMGTTLCAMALVRSAVGGSELAVINVGDSRCYQWRDDALTQITRDHSLVEDMRAAGQITDAEAAVHPNRNIVTRALGIQPEVEVDEFVVVPRSGDRYILCSDGLFNEVSSERIGATLRRLADPNDAASELVRQANEAGGRDNITCVVVDILDDDGSAEKADAAGLAPIRRRNRIPDVAGITAARTSEPTTERLDDDDASEKPGRRGRRRAARAEAEIADTPTVRLRRATWRTAFFVVGVLAVLVVAALAVGWYSRGSYFVGYASGGEVTIFKGRPDAVLWFQPTVTKRTGIAKAQVPETMRDDLAAGKQQSSLSDATAYVDRMRTIICSNLRNGSVPTASAPGAPTTTIPAECADLASPRPPVNEPGTPTTTTQPSSSSTTRPTATTAP